jgi:amino acid adenylation domain-containing protein
MLLHERFEIQVTKTPDATAVVADQGRLSYSELNARANQVARYLDSLEIGAGSRIGLCCERTIEMIVGIFGILKAGAAYVPLDPAYPRERLEYMAEAANLDVILTQKNLVECLNRLNETRLILLDDPGLETWDLSPENPRVAVGPDDPIYVIFTSGTTGRPKGAGVYHRGFSNLLDWFITDFRFSPQDRVLLVSSLSFDLTQKNLFAPLITGGCLFLFAPGPYEVGRLKKAIQDHQITSINCTPSAFYPLIDDCVDHTPVRSLRLAVLGGEPISLSRLRGWIMDPSCQAEVANTYGPTECTDICAFYRLNRANFDHFEIVPLGGTIPNVQLVVVNEALEECGIGEPGELLVGGVGVGSGYINDSELTAKKFIPNPFPEVRSPVIYRTGDQVRWLSEGLLEFIGRKDHQVKIRGFRIELSEVEAAVSQHPSMREAIVLVKEAADPRGNAQLRCYFTLKHGESLSLEALREFIAARLPDYMMPATFHQIAAFPLSSNGKVDRAALKELKLEEAKVPAAINSSDSLQNKILGTWISVLGSQNIGLDDNFFDIGGDSLALAQVHTRLQSFTGRNFPITELFANTTVRRLAKHLSGSDTAGSRQSLALSRAQLQRQALSAGRSLRK